MADSAAAPRPQSASLDIDDGLSDAAESPRSDACVNWPRRRRRRRSPRPAPTAVLVRLALGTVAASLAYAGHSKFKRSDLYGVADRSKWRSCAGYDTRDFAAVAAATVGFPVAWFCFAGAGSAAARIGSLPVLMVLAAGALVTIALAYRDASSILKCGVLWCDAAVHNEASNYATAVALMLLIGGSSAFLLFAGLAFRVARRRSTPSTTLTEPLLDDEEAGAPEPIKTKAPNTIAWTVSLIVALALLLLLTSILPNSWQGFTTAGIAKYRRTGPGSMVDQWTRAAPEGRKAWFRTAFYQINARLTLKVYPDVAMYYAFLMVLALVACAGRVSLPFARLLRRRVRVAYSAWSVGELVASSLFALLLVRVRVASMACGWVKRTTNAGRLRALRLRGPPVRLGPDEKRVGGPGARHGAVRESGIGSTITTGGAHLDHSRGFWFGLGAAAMGPYLGRLRDVIVIRCPCVVLV